MALPVFRNPDMFQELPIRNYLRRLAQQCRLPTGKGGYVVEDLDLVVRHFGQRYELDASGRFMLVEQKHPGSYINPAQTFTFGLMHRTLRAGDPQRERYIGYYVLNIAFTEDDDPIFPVTVNRQHTLNETRFIEWLDGALILPSLFDQ